LTDVRIMYGVINHVLFEVAVALRRDGRSVRGAHGPPLNMYTTYVVMYKSVVVEVFYEN